MKQVSTYISNCTCPSPKLPSNGFAFQTVRLPCTDVVMSSQCFQLNDRLWGFNLEFPLQPERRTKKIGATLGEDVFFVVKNK